MSLAVGEPAGGSTPASRISMVLLAAVAENGVIGRANALPWRLKSDMQHFRAVTMGHPLIIGRKTFQSLSRPLKGRTVIVITRDRAFAAADVVVAASFAAAFAAARGDALRRGVRAIMVVGGAEIYAQAMPHADRLLITRVHSRPDGDTLFPPVDGSIWRERTRMEHAAGDEDSAAFAFVDYERVSATPTAHRSRGDHETAACLATGR